MNEQPHRKSRNRFGRQRVEYEVDAWPPAVGYAVFASEASLAGRHPRASARGSQLATWGPSTRCLLPVETLGAECRGVGQDARRASNCRGLGGVGTLTNLSLVALGVSGQIHEMLKRTGRSKRS